MEGSMPKEPSLQDQLEMARRDCKRIKSENAVLVSLLREIRRKVQLAIGQPVDTSGDEKTDTNVPKLVPSRKGKGIVGESSFEKGNSSGRRLRRKTTSADINVANQPLCSHQKSTIKPMIEVVEEDVANAPSFFGQESFEAIFGREFFGKPNFGSVEQGDPRISPPPVAYKPKKRSQESFVKYMVEVVEEDVVNAESYFGQESFEKPTVCVDEQVDPRFSPPPVAYRLEKRAQESTIKSVVEDVEEGVMNAQSFFGQECFEKPTVGADEQGDPRFSLPHVAYHPEKRAQESTIKSMVEVVEEDVMDAQSFFGQECFEKPTVGVVEQGDPRVSHTPLRYRPEKHAQESTIKSVVELVEEDITNAQSFFSQESFEKPIVGAVELGDPGVPLPPMAYCPEKRARVDERGLSMDSLPLFIDSSAIEAMIQQLDANLAECLPLGEVSRMSLEVALTRAEINVLKKQVDEQKELGDYWKQEFERYLERDGREAPRCEGSLEPESGVNK